MTVLTGMARLMNAIHAGSQKQDDGQLRSNVGKAAAALAAAAITFGAQPSLAAFRLPPLDPGDIFLQNLLANMAGIAKCRND